jgi:hypothetical protein
MISEHLQNVITEAFACKGATISSTAKAITHSDFAWGANDSALAVRVFITARGAGVMCTWSGDAPTANLGHFIPENGTIEVLGNRNIQRLKFIREDATDAELTITMERWIKVSLDS